LLVGVTGDTHNNLKNISKICEIFNEINPLLVVHTGDITLPKSLSAFRSLNVPLIGVFGNNDEMEKEALILESKKFECQLFEEPHLIEINNKNIYILHHPNLITDKMSMNADFILHGHTHRFRSEILNGSLIFNPGECAGIMKGKNKIGLIDTENNKSKIISF
tara:strand:+ start:127 stop:615 length:489 start_codon:yes stop_codon:yes gene_type:complete